MSNDELQLSVTEELIWDPKVDSDAIAVSARIESELSELSGRAHLGPEGR